jgi:hypothetical protein
MPKRGWRHIRTILARSGVFRFVRSKWKYLRLALFIERALISLLLFSWKLVLLRVITSLLFRLPVLLRPSRTAALVLTLFLARFIEFPQ